MRREGPERLVVAEALATRREVDIEGAVDPIDDADAPRGPAAAPRREAGGRATEDAGDDRAPIRREDGDPDKT